MTLKCQCCDRETKCFNVKTIHLIDFTFIIFQFNIFWGGHKIGVNYTSKHTNVSDVSLIFYEDVIHAVKQHQDVNMLMTSEKTG